MTVELFLGVIENLYQNQVRDNVLCSTGTNRLVMIPVCLEHYLQNPPYQTLNYAKRVLKTTHNEKKRPNWERRNPELYQTHIKDTTQRKKLQTLQT